MTKEGMYRSTMVLEYEAKVMTNPTLSSTRNGYKNNNSLYRVLTTCQARFCHCERVE